MEPTAAVRALAALAQETRLSIFRRLVAAGPTGLAAGEISAELKIAPATLSFHLKELSTAGLAGARQEGRFIFYSAQFGRMSELLGFLTENCCERDGVICALTDPCRAAPEPAATSRSRTRKPVPG